MLVYTDAMNTGNCTLFHASESNSGRVYTETSSKNRLGRTSALKPSRKEPAIFAAPEEGECCPIFILDTYVEQVLQSAISHDN